MCWSHDKVVLYTNKCCWSFYFFGRDRDKIEEDGQDDIKTGSQSLQTTICKEDREKANKHWFGIPVTRGYFKAKERQQKPDPT